MVNITPAGYRRIEAKDGRSRFEHVLIWEAEHGPIPKDHVLIHINDDKLDNKLENLKLVTKQYLQRTLAGWILDEEIWYKKCDHCSELKKISEYNNYKNKYSTLCKSCNTLKKRQPITKKPKVQKDCVTIEGYRFIMLNGIRKMEHIRVWEEVNGPVLEDMQIHHVNFDKLDNRIENLMCVDQTTHQRLHAGWELRNGTWFKPCGVCKELKSVETEYFSGKRGARNGLITYCSRCKPCHIKYKKDLRDKHRAAGEKVT